jgi:Bacterial PH domain
MNTDMTPQTTPEDYSQPVAYDVDGRPLYAHPPVPTGQPDAPPQVVVHMARPIDPVKQVVSVESQIKHDAAKKLYPYLNISDGEYVISAVRRHPIGLFLPLLAGISLLTITFFVMFNFQYIATVFELTGPAADPAGAILPLSLLSLLILIGTYVAYYVYTNNKFFLTNESVIQEIQVSLFSRHEQTVSLANIEDASFEQRGIIAQIFDFGEIRLSTEGDETTYRFTYVANPKRHIEVLNNAVEAFKNGRPVSDSDN